MQQKIGPTAPRLSYKIKECADLTGLSEASIRRAIQRGLLTPCRAFRHPLIPAEQLQRLIAGQ
jgi:hypothetical protein